MRRREPKHISDVISEMIAATGSAAVFDRQRVCYLWGEIVGESINRYTLRRYVEGSVLHVYITSASLKSELSFLKERLVERLNEAAGAPLINNIIIH